jgi:L-amino acid N-acyltransferase YncA
MMRVFDAAAGAGTVAPDADREQLVLRDGSTVIIAPLVTGDDAAVMTWFEGLGPDARHDRFLGSVKALDERTRRALVQVDHYDYEALRAVADDGVTIGIAHYLRLGQPGVAEVSVAVVDGWRGRGIASLLLDRLACRARAAGVSRFIAVCYESNDAVCRLLRRLGPTTIGPSEVGVVEVHVELYRVGGVADQRG